MPDCAYRFVIEAMTFNHDILQSSIQILNASSAMVKTMTPKVIPGAFYFPDAKPRENITLRGSPR